MPDTPDQTPQTRERCWYVVVKPNGDPYAVRTDASASKVYASNLGDGWSVVEVVPAVVTDEHLQPKENHMLTIGNERIGLRITRGRLDRHGRFHDSQPCVFLLWRGRRMLG